MIMRVQLLGSPPPTTFGRAKNVPNSARFNKQKKLYELMLTHPSALFSRQDFGLRECWSLKFLHDIGFDQRLLVHTANGDGGPPNFKGEHL